MSAHAKDTLIAYAAFEAPLELSDLSRHAFVPERNEPELILRPANTPVKNGFLSAGPLPASSRRCSVLNFHVQILRIRVLPQLYEIFINLINLYSPRCSFAPAVTASNVFICTWYWQIVDLDSSHFLLRVL